MLSLAMTSYVGMDLPRFVALVWARRRLLAVIVVVAAALALLASLTQTRQYRAGADLLFGSPTNVGTVVSGGVSGASQPAARAAANNLALASLDTVASRVKRRFPGPGTAAELRRALSIESAGQTELITVTARAGKAAQAAAIANAFAEEIVAFRRDSARAEIQRAIDGLRSTLRSDTPRSADTTTTLRARLSQLQALKGLETGDVRIVQSATAPAHPSSPRPVRDAVLAASVAFVVGLILVLLFAAGRDRIEDEEQVAAIMGAPVLAKIPDAGREQRRRVISQPEQDASLVEAFEFLRLNLELMRPTQDGVIVVTSPGPAAGKSTLVAWLARSLARSGADVVAVDLDIHRPGLSGYFRAAGGAAFTERDQGTHGSGPAPDALLGAVAQSHGASDAPAGIIAPEAAIDPDLVGTPLATAVPGVPSLIADSNHPYLTATVASRERLEALFDETRAAFGWVLVDAAPLGIVADTTAIAAAADGVILVVDLAEVRGRDLVAAKRQLSGARVEVLGVVLNRVARRASRRGRWVRTAM